MALRLTYAEVGSTAGELPSGYHHLEVSTRLGTGRAVFTTAAARLTGWDMHRRAGIGVPASLTTVEPGQQVELRIGPGRFALRAPVQVIEVVAEAERAGFTYGTLTGHPEVGEERFEVAIDARQEVVASIRAFSRPGRWYTAAAGLLGPVAQRVVTRRYLDALR